MYNLIILLLFPLSIFFHISANENEASQELLTQQAPSNYPTPTQIYLQTHSIDNIKEFSGVNAETFDRMLPFFMKLVAEENGIGFFGYHASTQNYRIFQDILRAVFEEVFGYDIPEHFQFLRIPGDPLFDLKNGIASFYEMFDRRGVSKKNKQEIVRALFLQPYKEKFNVNLQISDLKSQEINQLWKIVLEFVETLDSLAKEDYYLDELGSDQMGLTNHQKTAWPEETQDDPYVLSFKKKLKAIMSYLDTNQEDHVALGLSFNSNSSSKQLGNIFTRVLSTKKVKYNNTQLNDWVSRHTTFRSLLNETYYFPWHDFHQNFSYHHFFFPYSDVRPEQQSRVLCMNLSLFANYHRRDESTTWIYLQNQTIEGGDSHVMDSLRNFFQEIGIDPAVANDLHDIAEQELSITPQTQNGIILQFFDQSPQLGLGLYQGIDHSVFVAHSFGIPIKHIPASHLAQSLHPLRHNSMDLQMRLVTDTYSTLNPYSFLRIRRYDSNGPIVAWNIIQKMREKLKKVSADKDKLAVYKAQLDAKWLYYPMQP